jgi:hypothetical protein
VDITWAKALGWRLGRQLLDPVGSSSVAEVVGQLGAVPSWPDPTPQVSIGMRRSRDRPGDLSRALASGAVLRAYAFRGAVHVLTPATAGRYLVLRAIGRQWELPSWQEAYHLSPAQWPDFQAAIRDALADGPLTREQLRAVVRRKGRFAAAADGLGSQSDTLLKALMWQGDACFGPIVDGVVTVQALAAVSGWKGLPDVDVAGRQAVIEYVRVFGPTTPEGLRYYLGSGLSTGPALRRWLADVEDRLVTVDIEGEAALVLAEDVDSLASATASSAVRLLPSADPWVMGPGTADPHVIPRTRRSLLARGNPVLTGGVVTGTWTQARGGLTVAWFPESGRPDHALLAAEAARLADLIGQDTALTVTGV